METDLSWCGMCDTEDFKTCERYITAGACDDCPGTNCYIQMND